MITISRPSATIILGLALATIAVTAGMANSGGSSTQCGVTAKSESGMLALEGSIQSPVPVSGEYRFSIQSSSNGGSSNISQGGYFTANANEATPLGKVMINAGAKYQIDFDVTAGGKKIVCEQDVAGLR